MGDQTDMELVVEVILEVNKLVVEGSIAFDRLMESCRKSCLTDNCRDLKLDQCGQIGLDTVNLGYRAWFIETTVDALRAPAPLPRHSR